MIDSISFQIRPYHVFLQICVFLISSHHLSAADLGQELPSIEARTFDVKIQKRSQSDRVYLLSDQSEARPTPGKIILLKKSTEAVMAFRTLKDYGNEKKEFAARKVKAYGSYEKLEPGETYTAIEKIRDLSSKEKTTSDSTPEDVLKDEEDLKELETEKEVEHTPDPTPSPTPPPVYDSELDQGSSQSNASQNPSSASFDEMSDDYLNHLTVDEVQTFDSDKHWVSGGLGMFRIAGADKKDIMNYAGGASYAYTFGKMVFVSSNKLQDSMAAEFGLYLYKIVKYATTSDTYVIVPLSGTIRYNLLMSPDFTFFMYGGAIYNHIISTASSTSEGITALKGGQRFSIIPAVGVGLLFRVGPKWHIRTDIGYDRMALGLMIRF